MESYLKAGKDGGGSRRSRRVPPPSGAREEAFLTCPPNFSHRPKTTRSRSLAGTAVALWDSAGAPSRLEVASGTRRRAFVGLPPCACPRATTRNRAGWGPMIAAPARGPCIFMPRTPPSTRRSCSS